MTFATEVVKDGRGRVLRIDFSTDAFATIYARYATHAGVFDGSNYFEPRIVSCSALRKGFGEDHIAAAATVEITFENTDGAVDWLADRSTMSTLAKLRARLYVETFEPGNVAGGFSVNQLGEFSLAEWPRRSNETVTAVFADDMLAGLGRVCQLPTLSDWEAIGTSANNPLHDGFSYGPRTTQETTAPIVFGEDWVRTLDPVFPKSGNSAWNTGTSSVATYDTGKLVIPICCTSLTTSESAADSLQLRVALYKGDGSVAIDGPLLDVPSSFTSTERASTVGTATIWSVARSGTITKGGISYKITYLLVDTWAFYYWASENQIAGDPMWWGKGLAGPTGPINGGGLTGPDGGPAWCYWPRGYPTSNLGDGFWRHFTPAASRVAEWYVRGYPLSAKTQDTAREQHACDVLTDLASYYAQPTLSVDSTSKARLKTALPYARCAGSIGGPGARPQPLRVDVSRICQSADLDVYINSSGQLAFACPYLDATLSDALLAATLKTVDETRLIAIEDWIPALGDRGCPYNRVTLRGGKPNYPERADVPSQGPFTLPSTDTTGIAIADRVVDVVLEQGWRPWAQQARDPLRWRLLETHARPRVRFTTTLDALLLDLGEFFMLTWTRGLSPAIYDSTVFQVESLTYVPESDTVEIEAIWRHELASDRSYLLDNQAYPTRYTASGGATVTVTDADTSVAVTGVDLTTQGVQIGDVLVLLDATQTPAIFTRFRALRIADFDASSITLEASSDLDFDAPGGTAVSTWEVRASAVTYPTAITDPTHYATGGDMYGKVADGSTLLYSNSAVPNKLLHG